MATTTQNIGVVNRDVAGQLADYDSTPLLRDDTQVFGVKDFITNTVIVAAGTALTRTSKGTYTYPVAGLTVGRVYVYAVERVYNGSTEWVQKVFLAVSGSGGTTPIAGTFVSYMSTVTSVYIEGIFLSVPQNSAPTFTLAIFDNTGNPIDLSGKTLRFIGYALLSSATPVFKRETGGNGIVLGGVNLNQAAVTLTTGNTATAAPLHFVLWNVTDSMVLAKGVMDVQLTPIDYP